MTVTPRAGGNRAMPEIAPAPPSAWALLLPQDVYLEDGLSGSTLVRPALERLRDRVAEGGVDRLYVHSPDRMARKCTPTRCCCSTSCLVAHPCIRRTADARLARAAVA